MIVRGVVYFNNSFCNNYPPAPTCLTNKDYEPGSRDRYFVSPEKSVRRRRVIGE